MSIADSADVELGASGAENEAATLSGADNWIGRWLDHLARIRGLAKGTVARYARWVLQADQSMGGAWTVQGVDDWLRGAALRGASGSTLRQVLAALRSAGEYRVLAGEAESNPCSWLRGPRTYTPRRATLTVGEVVRICFGGDRRGALPADPIGARNRTLLALVYVAGLRVGDVERLQTADVEVDEGGGMAIVLRHAKWAVQDHVVPIVDPPTRRMIAGYLAEYRPLLPKGRALFPGVVGDRGLTPWAVWSIWRRALEDAEVEPRGRRLTPHVLRHSLAHHLLKQGIDVPTLQAVLRHRDVRNTMIYLAADEGAVAAAWRRRSPFKPAAAAKADLAKLAKGLL